MVGGIQAFLFIMLLVAIYIAFMAVAVVVLYKPVKRFVRKKWHVN